MDVSHRKPCGAYAASASPLVSTLALACMPPFRASLVQLEGYRRFNEEAALRDHRKLGMELDLFR